MKKMRMKKIGALLMVMLMLVTSYIPLFPALEVKAQEKKSTKASGFFDNVVDIDPVNNPATSNWLTKLVAKAVGVPEADLKSLTQAHFDSITYLKIPGTSLPNKNWEMPKEWANLRFLTELEALAISTATHYNRVPDEFFQLPSMKILRLPVDMSNFPEKTLLAEGLEELYLTGKIGLVGGVTVSDGIKNLKSIEVLYINNAINITFPDSFGELTNLREIEARLGQINLPDTIGNLTKLEKLSIGGKIDGISSTLSNCTSLKKLELNFTDKVKTFPDISAFTNIEILDLKGINSEFELPMEMDRFKKLRTLSLTGPLVDNKTVDGIEELPESIGTLENLETLTIMSPKLKKLPESLSQVTTLTSLDLRECASLGSLPQNIGNLANLTKLDLNMILPSIGGLTYLPDSFGNLTNLTELNFRNQQLRKLPESIGNMTKAITMDVAGNQLEEIPESIKTLLELRTLDASRNQIKEIPNAIGELSLGQLKLQGNKISSLPEAIKDLSGGIDAKIDVNLSYNAFKTMPDLTLFKKGIVKTLYLDYCQISDLGEWVGPNNAEGILKIFFENQGPILSGGISLIGNNIIGIPASWGGVSTKRDIKLNNQVSKTSAKFDSVGKKATLQNPIWLNGESDATLGEDKYNISNGGTYDKNTRTFTWTNNVKEGDVYTIQFDASGKFASNGLRIINFKGTLYVTVGETQNTGFKVTLHAQNEKGEDITKLWPEDFSREYGVLAGEVVPFKLPSIEGHSLISADGYDTDPSAITGVVKVDGLIFLHGITAPKEVIFRYKAKSHNVNIKLQESGSGQDLSALVSDPNYKFQYTINERGNTIAIAPTIAGYGIKGESAKTLSNILANQTVIFEYVPESQIVSTTSKVSIKLIDISNNEELNSFASGFEFIRDVPKKTGFSVIAPVLSLAPEHYKLASGQESSVAIKPEHTVGDSYTAYIYYEKDEYAITITAKDDKGMDLLRFVPGGYKTYLKVGKGTTTSIPAPVIEGYELSSANAIVPLENVNANQTISFVYKKQICKVTVVARDQNKIDITGLVKQPYQIVRNVPYGETITVAAPTLIDLSYTLQEPLRSIRYPRITGDQIVEFGYEGENAIVTIIAKHGETEITRQIVSKKIGTTAAIKALEVDGYVLADGEEVSKSVEVLAKGAEVVFNYQPALQEMVTISIELRDTTELGALLNDEVIGAYQFTRTMEKGSKDYTVEAPGVKGYTLGHLKEVTYTTVDMDKEVIFIYNRTQATIKVETKDAITGKTIDYVDPKYEYTRLVDEGTEKYPLPAPVVPGYDVVGLNPRPLEKVVGNRTETFEYKKQIILTIKLVDELNQPITDEVLEGDVYKLLRTVKYGEGITIPAPTLANYGAASPSERVYKEGELKANDTIIFKYTRNTVKVTVELYDVADPNTQLKLDEGDSYKLDKEVRHGDSVTIEPPVLKNYEAATPSDYKYQAGELTGPVTLRFTYVGKQETLTVETIDATTGETIAYVDPEYEYTKSVQKGMNYDIPAPVIPDYTVVGLDPRPLGEVTESQPVIFEYTKNVKEMVTISIELRDTTELGALLNDEVIGAYQFTRTMEKGSKDYTVEAPGVKGYTLGHLKEVTYTTVDTDKNIIFIYNRTQATIKVETKDAITGKTIDYVDPKYEYTRLVDEGTEKYPLPAPVVPGYDVVGLNPRPLEKVVGNRTETFEYKKQIILTIKLVDELNQPITDEVLEGDVYKLLRTVKYGEGITIPAPTLANYGAASPSERVYKEGELKANDTIIFKYTRNTVKVTVELYDVADPNTQLKLDEGDSYKLDKEVRHGDSVTIEPPVLKNYEAATPSDYKYQAGELTGPVTLRFTYVGKQETLTVETIDATTGETIAYVDPEYEYTKSVQKGMNYDIPAPVIPDYTVVGLDPRPLGEVTESQPVIFEYTKNVKEMVTISIELRDTTELGALLNDEVIGAYQFTRTMEKGSKDYTVEAPGVKGYTLGHLKEVTYTTVDMDKEVIFIYNRTQATIKVETKDAITGKTIDYVDPKYEYTRLVDEGTEKYPLPAPVVPGYDVVGLNPRPLEKVVGNRTETFEYKKQIILTIKLVDELNQPITDEVLEGDVYKLLRTVKYGEGITIPAPTLANYGAASPSERVYKEGELKANDTIIFKYTRNTVKVTVELYDVADPNTQLKLDEGDSYKLDKEVRHGDSVTIEPPVLKNYEAATPSDYKYQAGELTGPVTLRFTYVGKQETLTVETIDATTGETIAYVDPEYEYTKSVQKGMNYDIPAPVIPDYTVVGLDPRPLGEVTESQPVIFEYTKNVKEMVTISIELRDTTELGALLNDEVIGAYQFTRTMEKGSKDYTVEAPGVKGYTLGHLKEVTYTTVDTDKNIIFIYNRTQATIKVETKDAITGKTIDYVDPKYEYTRLVDEGTEKYPLPAPVVPGYDVVGLNPRPLEKVVGNRTETFEYKKQIILTIKLVDELNQPITDEVLEGDVYKLLRTVKYGEGITIPAPTLANYGAASPSERVYKEGELKANDTIIFKYTRNTVKVTVELYDVADPNTQLKLDEGDSYKLDKEVRHGDSVTIEPPVLKNYEAATPSDYKYQAGELTGPVTLRFTYVGKQETLTVETIDATTGETIAYVDPEYEYTKSVQKGMNYDIPAPVIPDYTVVGLDPRPLGEVTESQPVIFEYTKNVKEMVTISIELRDTTELGALLNDEVIGAYQFTRTMEKGSKDYTVEAPGVKGYTLGHLKEVTYTTVDTDKNIIFIYNRTQATIKVETKDAITGKTIDYVDPKYEYTRLVDEGTEKYPLPAPVVPGYDVVGLNPRPLEKVVGNRTETFEYKKQIILTIKLVDELNQPITDEVLEGDVYKLLRTVKYGEGITIPAPTLANYGAASPSERVYKEGELKANDTIIFKYTRNTVKVTVELYDVADPNTQLKLDEGDSYKLDKEVRHGDSVTIEPPVLKNYEAATPSDYKYQAGELTGPVTLRFTYVGKQETLTVETIDATTGETIAYVDPEYEYTKSVQKGMNYDIPAPVIPDYTVVGLDPRPLGEVTESQPVIFEYTKNVKEMVTISIELRDTTELGALLNDEVIGAYQFTRTMEKGSKDYTVEAPGVKGYTLGHLKEVTYTTVDTDKNIIFIYNRTQATIKVETKDAITGKTIDYVDPKYEYTRLVDEGTEKYPLPAPVVPGYDVVGLNPRPLEKVVGNRTETFEYKKQIILTIKLVDELNQPITDEVLEGDVYKLLRTVKYGEGITIPAPTLANYGAASPSERVYKEGELKANDTIIFKYTRNTVKVTVELYDVADPNTQLKLDEGDSYKLDKEVRHGDSVTIEPPVLKNYEAATPSDYKYQAGELTGPVTLRFTYVGKQETLTVETIDATTGETIAYVDPEYEYTKSVQKGMNYDIPAPVIPDYTVVGLDPRPLGEVTESQPVIFEYTKNVKEMVTISIELRDTTELGALLNDEVIGAYQFTRTMEKGSKDYTVEAPGVKGYTLGHLKEVTYTTVDTDKNIIFIYNRTQATIKVETKDAITGKTIDYVDPKYEYTRLVDEGTEKYPLPAPVVPGYDVVGLNPRPLEKVVGNRTETFEYKKQIILTIKLVDELNQPITDEVLEGDVYKLLRTVKYGEGITIPAPTLANYGAASPSERVYKEGELKANDTIIFKYTRNTVKVTVELYDVADPNTQLKLDEGDSYKLDKEVRHGDSVTIEPPVLKNYEAATPSDYKYQAGELTGPVTLRFTYVGKQETLTVETIDATTGETIAYVDPEYEYTKSVQKGMNYDIPAPVIPDYTVVGLDPKPLGEVTASQKVTFEYTKNVKEMVTISIELRDTTKSGTLLNNAVIGAYQFTRTMEKGTPFKRIDAPKVENYLIGVVEFVELFNIQKDQKVIFLYSSDMAIIKILVKDEEGKDLTGDVAPGQALELQKKKLVKHVIDAPVVNGHTIKDKDAIKQTILPTKDTEEVTFIYTKDADPKPEYATITILVEDKDGNLLPSDVLVGVDLELQLEKGIEGTVPAPVIKGYTPELSKQVIKPMLDTETVTFVYTKDADPKPEYATITILVEDKDGNLLPSDVLVGVDLELQLEKGIEGTVPAPVIKGYTSELSKQVIKPMLDTETVTFVYTKDADPKPEYATITILVEDKDGNLLPSDVLVGVDLEIQLEKGIEGTVPAPVINGYTAELSEQVIKPMLDTETVTFVYTKDADPKPKYATITILVKDKDGSLLPSDVLVGVDLEIQLEKGIEGTVPAPVINGYTAELSEQVIKPRLDTETITFVYTKNTIPDPEKKVFVTIQVKDTENNDLSQSVSSDTKLVYEVVKDEYHKVNAPVIAGYQLADPSITFREFKPITGHETVLFTYRAEGPEQVSVTIQVRDENNNDLTGSVVAGTELIYNVNKGDNHRVKAPVISGYKVDGVGYIDYTPITQNEKAFFTYKKDNGPKNPILEISQSELTVKQGERINLKKMIVKATDSTNKDLQNKVKFSTTPAELIPGNSFKADIIGTFEVVFTLPHEAGNVTKTLTITVNSKNKPKSPTLRLSIDSITMSVGESIDLSSYVQSAIDPDDGSDLKDQVTWTVGRLRSMSEKIFAPIEAGTYQVTYRLESNAGGISTQAVDIEVKTEETKVDQEKTNPNKTNNETQTNKQQKVEKTGVKTGDEQPLVLILILSMISAFGVSLVSKKKYP